jgi:pyruvate kinase
MPTGAMHRRAKILCTLGPASRSAEMIGKLIDAGMNGARLNFSHGSHADHEATYGLVREQSSLRDVPIAIVADLQGPKIRAGKIPDPGFDLVAGEVLVLSVDPEAKVGREGALVRVTTTYEHLPRDAEPGQRILLDDGNLEVRVVAVEGPEVHTEVVQGGRLTSNKGINLPGTRLSTPSLTPKDEEDLRFALRLGVDAIALSFVRRADDIGVVKAIMHEVGIHRPVIAKIEKPEAIDNLDEIVDAAEGIMVARGDLGVEVGPEVVPVLQKRVIDLANRRGKLVITATQMLESMIHAARPTRAEASDVANAVLDGSDAVMLSGETAVGVDPARVVATMDRIIRVTESEPRFWSTTKMEDKALGHTTNAIAQAAVACTHTWTGTKAIVTYTGSGGSARLISDYRPRVPIYAFTPNPEVYQALALYWGVVPTLFSPSSPSGESVLTDLDRAIIRRGFLEAGDQVVVSFGYPIRAKRSTNLLKLHHIGETTTLG